MNAPTPLQTCGTVTDKAVLSSDILMSNSIMGTVYEAKVAYETATGKPYRFKTQQERMAYMLEAMKTSRCVG
jgi:hypothetical protein